VSLEGNPNCMTSPLDSSLLQPKPSLDLDPTNPLEADDDFSGSMIFSPRPFSSQQYFPQYGNLYIVFIIFSSVVCIVLDLPSYFPLFPLLNPSRVEACARPGFGLFFSLFWGTGSHISKPPLFECKYFLFPFDALLFQLFGQVSFDFSSE